MVTTLRLSLSDYNRHKQASICLALSKQGERFLTSVATRNDDNPAITAKLIRKFIASSSKSVALDAISHLVSPNNNAFSRLSPLAFPVSLFNYASLLS